MGVSLQRTATALTADVSHWGAILNITEAMSFNNYNRFMEMIFCGDRDLSDLPPFEQDRFAVKEQLGRKLLTRRSLPFIDTDAYRLIKVATEAFVMVNCGIIASTAAAAVRRRPRQRLLRAARRAVSDQRARCAVHDRVPDALLGRRARRPDAAVPRRDPPKAGRHRHQRQRVRVLGRRRGASATASCRRSSPIRACSS